MLFFKLLRKSKEYEWSKECETAFQSIKEYLGNALLLVNPSPSEILYIYLSITKKVVSDVLVGKKEDGKQLVYYVSQALTKS